MALLAAPGVQEGQHKALTRMLAMSVHDGAQVDPGTWKVLVYDRYCQDVIAPQLKVGALRSYGVTLHVPLLSQRTPVPEVAALYLIEPTQANVERVVADCQAGMYASYAVNFSTSCSSQLLEQLAKGLADSEANVVQVVDRFVHFVSVGPRLFSLEMPDAYERLHSTQTSEAAMEALLDRIAEGLLSALVTMRACPVIRCAKGEASEYIARKLEQKLRELLKSAQSAELFLPAHAARPLLLLLDRDADLGVMLQHTWTYHAMAHDVLGWKNNRVSVPVEVEPGKPPQVKAYDTESSEQFWQAHSAQPFPQVAEAVHEEIEAFERKRAAIAAQDSSGLGSAMSALPEMTEKKRAIDMHTNLATALLAEIKERAIDTYIELENDVAMGKSVGSLVTKTCEVLADPRKGSLLDKMRLILVVYLARPEMSEAQLSQLAEAYATAGGDARALTYVQHLASMKKMARTPQVERKDGPTVMNALLGNQLGGLASKVTGAATGLAAAGLATAAKGVTMVLQSEKELLAAKTIEALLDGSRSELTEPLLYLDPRGHGDARAQGFKSGLVFAVGGGNFVEAYTLTEKFPNVTYGSTDFTAPAAFHDTLARLA